MEPQVNLLHRVSNIVSSERSLDEMLGEIIGLTVQVTQCDACLVYLIEKETGDIVLRARRFLMQPISELADGDGRRHHRMGGGAQIGRRVAVERRTDNRFKRFPALVEDTYEAFLSVPLIAVGEMVGASTCTTGKPTRTRPKRSGWSRS